MFDGCEKKGFREPGETIKKSTQSHELIDLTIISILKNHLGHPLIYESSSMVM